MTFKPPRGTWDLLPDKMVRREYVVQKIREVIERYGYGPMESPAIESLGLLQVKCGRDLKEQIYGFKDKKGRDLGLRYDLTVPLARVVANNPQLPKPFKRYCISRVWRYEKPTAGRRREFFQCDMDIVGSPEPAADAETIAVAADCLKALGLSDFFVRLNDRNILEGILKLTKIGTSKKLEVFRAIDKLAKIGEEGVKEELQKIGVSASVSDDLLKLIGKSGPAKEVLSYTKKLLKGIKIAEVGCSRLEGIIAQLVNFGLSPELITADLSLARGIDYYTGPIFEIIVKGEERLGSVAGGGRYDTLIELCGGRPTPATGISLGIERLVEVLDKRGLLTAPKVMAKVFVASADESVRPKAIAIAQMLRNKRITADIDLVKRKLTAQLEYADKKGFPYAIVVGRKELQKDSVVLRNMLTKKQKTVKIADLVRLLRASK